MANGASEQDGELRPGDVLSGYRIVSLIAAGGMGDVYEAVHEATDKTVALKCLKQRHREKEDARSRMKMEAVVLCELRHANLVQVYDAGMTDLGTVWFAMERLHGRTLRDLMHRSGRLSVPDALYYASEVADGIAAVHEANVVHRDLKPENVFVTERKLVKVLDLGTGKFTGYGLKSTDGARVIGTTAYMAPEQIKGMRVDARADVYALGVMVYEMIAGRHPLADALGALPRAIEQVALLQLQATPQPLADAARGCPPYLCAVVEKAMAKDREQRQASIAALSAELRAARKRFVAENRIDESAVDLRAGSDRLREKLGAPPRAQATPVTPVIEVSLDLARTEIQGPPDFTHDGSDARSAREPTLELSVSSLSSPAPSVAPAAPPAPNLPTRTNPLGVGRPSDPTPEPLSVPRGSGAGRSRARRLALTLGLGALIGIPPAVFAVYWGMGGNAPHEPTARPEVVAPIPASPALDPTATATATPTTTATTTTAPSPPASSPSRTAIARPRPTPPRATPERPPPSPPTVPTPRALPSSGL